MARLGPKVGRKGGKKEGRASHVLEAMSTGPPCHSSTQEFPGDLAFSSSALFACNVRLPSQWVPFALPRRRRGIQERFSFQKPGSLRLRLGNSSLSWNHVVDEAFTEATRSGHTPAREPPPLPPPLAGTRDTKQEIRTPRNSRRISKR